jgi:Domain of unknown function (DUF397)
MSNEAISDWRVASYTGGQGDCVEVGTAAATIAVRDTKNREDGPVLCFGLPAWGAFIQRLKG